ncbi:MAG: hypothetical protein LUE17_10295 [Planctomycetaceae bacterium]|nr:hypothetical protein [Planctomycetaceae bacterium]
MGIATRVKELPWFQRMSPMVGRNIQPLRSTIPAIATSPRAMAMGQPSPMNSPSPSP